MVYLIDFSVFQPSTNNTSYPILLGHSWFYQAQAKDNWDRRTLTIGKGTSKIKLNTIDGEDLVANCVFIKPKALVLPFKRKTIYKELGLGKYILPCTNDENSDKVIES